MGPSFMKLGLFEHTATGKSVLTIVHRYKSTPNSFIVLVWFRDFYPSYRDSCLGEEHKYHSFFAYSTL